MSWVPAPVLPTRSRLERSVGQTGADQVGTQSPVPGPAAQYETLTGRTEVGGRIGALDNLKVVLVIGVILGHAAMTYGAAGSWIFEARRYGGGTLTGPVKALASAAIGLGVLFAMGLFLYIAGLFTPATLRRKGPRAFALGRIVRLGIPLVVYVAVVMPLLGVLIDRMAGTGTRDFASLYWRSLRDPSSGPLWFVAILLAFSLVVAITSRLLPFPAPRRAPLRRSYLVIAGATITIGAFGLRILFPIDSRQVLDLHVWLWPQCAVLFVLGVLSSQHGWLNPVPTRLWRASGFAAVTAIGTGICVLMVIHASQHALRGGPTLPALLIDGVEGLYAVSASIWMLGLFQRHFSHQGRLARRCSNNSYGAFIAQGPVLVGLALILQPLAMSGDLKFLLLASGSVVGSFVVGNLVIALLLRVAPRRGPRLSSATTAAG